ncbi:MAG: type VI secretion system domain-containing protein [Nannocystaceae bacterium]
MDAATTIAAAREQARPIVTPFSTGPRGGREARDDPRSQWIGDAMLVLPIVRREWPRIRSESEALLLEVGKDLRIAGIWAAAAFEREGLPGLAAGLAAIAGLLRELWDDLLPARARARENALANLYEHLGARLPAIEIGEDDRPALEACATLLDELHAAAMDRFAPPPMPKLARAELARLRASLPEVAPAGSDAATDAGADAEVAEDRSQGTGPKGQDLDARPSAAGSAPKPAADASSAPSAPSPSKGPAAPRVASPERTASPPPAPPTIDGDDDEAVQRFVGGLSQGMIKAAVALRRRRAADPLAYRLLRIAAWVRAAPPAAQAGRTTLAGLRPDARRSLEAMRANGKWAALVDAAESAFARPEARFHLDLHRFTLDALAGLGAEYAEARSATLGELAGLLRRMPGLVDLADREGLPLADDETRALFAREGLLGASAGAVGAAVSRDMSSGEGLSATGGVVGAASGSYAPPLVAPPPLPLTPVGVVAPAAGSRAPPLVAPPGTPPTRPPRDPAQGPVGAATPRADTIGASTSPQGQVPSNLSEQPGPGSADLPGLVAAAQARAAAGDPGGALALLQRTIDAAPSPRARFAARTALADLCRAVGQAPIAAALYAALEREARARELFTWEPALCAPVLEGLLLTPGASADERARVFADLCLLDPGAALRLCAAAPAPTTPSPSASR